MTESETHNQHTETHDLHTAWQRVQAERKAEQDAVRLEEAGSEAASGTIAKLELALAQLEQALDALRSALQR